MKQIYVIISLFLMVELQACMDEPDLRSDTPRGNFNALWEIIDTRYCYLSYKQINWDSVYTEYSHKIDTVSSNFSLFDVMGKMLATLKDGHVNLYSSFDRSRYWNWYTDYPSNFNSGVLFKPHYLGADYRIAGSLRYKKIANGKVGYIYYGSFSDSFSNENINQIFNSFSSCLGIIVDVRNNGGGMLSYAEQLASYFFDKKTLTGYLSHKTGTGHSDFSTPTPLYIEPNDKVKWNKKVMILTNRMSYSATNGFVNIMKYAPNSTIIGDQTGGGGGLPFSSELPNGWMVRFSSSPMYDADMQNIEWGIKPDIQVNMNAEAEARGYDTIIERAIGEIFK
ncbi:MAG TPA: S41 family peptidase [Paludibacteraceae bacterium]|nr:S41 family peptidase [Paludibacteraceae bacterium]HPT43415.1 S41 family peptidase [Paludibacteraceae bacterium]